MSCELLLGVPEIEFSVIFDFLNDGFNGPIWRLNSHPFSTSSLDERLGITQPMRWLVAAHYSTFDKKICYQIPKQLEGNFGKLLDVIAPCLSILVVHIEDSGTNDFEVVQHLPIAVVKNELYKRFEFGAPVKSTMSIFTSG